MTEVKRSQLQQVVSATTVNLMKVAATTEAVRGSVSDLTEAG
jgi:hypothetical protein